MASSSVPLAPVPAESKLAAPAPITLIDLRAKLRDAILPLYAHYLSYAPILVEEKLNGLEHGYCGNQNLLKAIVEWYDGEYQHLKTQTSVNQDWIEKIKKQADEAKEKIAKEGFLGQEHLLSQMAKFIERHSHDVPDAKTKIAYMSQGGVIKGHCDGFSFLDTFDFLNGRPDANTKLFSALAKWNGNDDSLDKLKPEILKMIDRVCKAQHPRNSFSIPQGRWHKIFSLLREPTDRPIKQNAIMIVPVLDQKSVGQIIDNFLLLAVASGKSKVLRIGANRHTTSIRYDGSGIVFYNSNSGTGPIRVKKAEELKPLLIASHTCVLKDVKAAEKLKVRPESSPATISIFSLEDTPLKFDPAAFACSLSIVKPKLALHYAIASGSKEVRDTWVKFFDLKSANYEQYSVYHTAACWDCGEFIAEASRSATAPDVNAKTIISERTPFHFAARYGFADVVIQFLRIKGIDVNAKMSAKAPKHAGWTAVLLAAKYGHVEVVRAIYNYDPVSINAITPDGKDIFKIARENGHPNVCKMLARKLLEKALKARNESEIIKLIQSGWIDVNEADRLSGLTLLHAAARNGYEQVIRVLMNAEGIQRDAKVTSIYSPFNGWTPFQIAVRFGQLKAARLILESSPQSLEAKVKPFEQRAVAPQSVHVRHSLLGNLQRSTYGDEQLDPQAQDQREFVRSY